MDYYTAKEALLNKPPGCFIFAQEKDPTCSKQTFHVSTHVDFFYRVSVEASSAPAPLKYHEWKFENERIKMFLDLESCELSADLFEIEVTKILSQLTEYGEPLLFTSSREGKQSLHVIYPYSIINTIGEVKKRVQKIKSPIIDMAVYKSGTLRMPYCTSFRSFPHTLKHYDFKTKTVTETFNETLFRLGTLHYFEIHGMNSAPYKIIQNKNYEPCKTYDKQMYEWVQKQGWNMVNYKEEDGTIKLLLRGVVCPKINRVHNSNNFYLRVELTSPNYPSFFGCLDGDCSDVRYNGPCFSTILKPDEIKKQLACVLPEVYIL